MLELDPRVEKVSELQKSEAYQEALALVEGWLAEEPEEPALLFCRGSLRLSSEDVPGAIADWEKALDGRMQLAARLQELYPQLVEKSFYNFHFETTVDNDSITHGALGRAYRLFGRFDEAIRHLGIALDLNPGAWSEGCLMATLLSRTGQSEAALQVLTRMVETRPDNVEILFHIGQYYFHQNSLAFALRHLEKAVKLDPADLRIRLVLGEIYLKQGRFDLGEPQFAECIQRGPSASAYLGMAECVKGQYRFDEALQHLRSAVDLEPRNLRGLLELGNLALQFGDLELGVDCLQRALEQEPHQPEVYALLAKAAQQRGDVPGAIDSYRKLLEMSPNEGVPNHSLGNLLRSQGQFAEARYHLEKAHDLMGRDVLVAMDLANCLVQLGDRPAALTLLRATLDAHPHHSELRSALFELDPAAVPVDRTLTSNLIVSQEEHNPWLDPEPTVAEVPSAPIAEPAPAPSPEPAPDPTTFDEFVERARQLVAQGLEADALKAYRKAVQLDPGQRECRLEAARLHAKKGLYDMASDYLVDAYRQAPRDESLWPELIDWLARVDEMDREESLSKLVLGIPADLERPPLFSVLYGLRRGEPREVLVDLIAQGLMSRFPSDQEARSHWESLKAGTIAPVYLEPPPEEPEHSLDSGEELPELEFVPEPSEEPAASVEVEPVEAPLPELEPVAEEEPLAEPSPAEPSPEEPPPAEVLSVEPSPPEDLSAEEPAPPSEEVSEGVSEEPVPASVETEEAPEPAEEWQEQPVADVVQEFLQSVEPPVAPALLADFPGPEGSGSPWSILAAAAENLHQSGWHREASLLWLMIPDEQRSRQCASQAFHGWMDHLREFAGDRLAEFESGLAQQFGELEARTVEEAAPPEAAPPPQAAEPATAAVAAEAAVEPQPQPEPEVEVAPEPEPQPELQLQPEPEPEVVEAVAEPEPAPPAPSQPPARVFDRLEDAQAALRGNPDDDQILASLFELAAGQDEVLLNFFRALSRDEPDQPLHCRNFARAYVRLNKPILAVVQYQKYLVARPSAAGYRELADTYALLKRDKNVAEALKKAEELEAAVS